MEKARSKPSGMKKEPDLEPTIRQKRNAKLAVKQQTSLSFMASMPKAKKEAAEKAKVSSAKSESEVLNSFDGLHSPDEPDIDAQIAALNTNVKCV